MLRGSMEDRKSGEFEPLPNQLLQHHIDDVGKILQRTRRLMASTLHRPLGLLSPRLDSDVIAKKQHVTTPGRTGSVTGQFLGNRSIASALRHIFDYRNGDFRERNKISQALKVLQQDKKPDARRRFSGPLFLPDQLNEIGRIDVSQFFGGRNSFQSRIGASAWSKRLAFGV